VGPSLPSGEAATPQAEGPTDALRVGLKAPRGGSTPGTRLPSWVVPALILTLVGGFGGGLAVGLLVAGAGDSGEAATTTTGPAPTTAPWEPADAYGATVAVDGSPLPMLGSAETDTAIGRPLPVITGTDFAGRPLTIAADGRPKLIVALAHWCPYCNAEVPILQEWYAGAGAEGIDVVTLSVYTDPNRSNFPPAAWLAEARWDLPLIADDSQRTLVTTLGIPAVPFWLLVSADGTVLQRLTGQLPAESLDAIAATLRGAGTP